MKKYAETNKLIAEFMGFQSTSIGWYDNEEVLNLPHTNDNTFDMILFHTSWEWLMPVVEKIESMEIDNVEYLSFSKNNFCVEIKSGFCQVISGDFLTKFDSFNRHSGSKHEATYKAVVEFINWYNEQQKDGNN